MKTRNTLLAMALMTISGTALAGGSLDVFYLDNTLDVEGDTLFGAADVDESGDGFGFRGHAELGKGIALTGLYQNAALDSRQIKDAIGSEVDTTETRFGVSYTHKAHEQITLVGNLETVQLDLEPEDAGVGIALDGYSIGGKLVVSPMSNLSVYGKLAYTDLGKLVDEDIDGIEYEAGAHYAVDKNIGFFAEYRLMDMETGNVDVQLKTLRLGGRYTF